MRSPTYPLINIYPGKTGTAADMNGILDSMLYLIADVAHAVQRPDGYGLLADPELKMNLTLEGNMLRVNALAAIAINGNLILQHPVYSPILCRELHDDPAQSEFFVFVRSKMVRQDWNLPGSPANGLEAMFKVPEYELHLKPVLNKDDSTQFPDALPIGRIYRKHGIYMVDDTFVPPCLHLKAVDHWWQSMLQSRLLWERMQKATNNIITQTLGVPYNAPLGDLNRFASWVWQYLVSRKPKINYLCDRSHPSELILLWAGIASLFVEYIEHVVQRAGEMLHIMDRYSQGRPGYVFNQQNALKSAKNLANINYEHTKSGVALTALGEFLQQVCMAWVFLGETSAIRWETDQNPLKL